MTEIYHFRLNAAKIMLLIEKLVISRKYPFRIVTNSKTTWNVVVIGTESKLFFGRGGCRDMVWFGLFIMVFYAYLKWNIRNLFPLANKHRHSYIMLKNLRFICKCRNTGMPEKKLVLLRYFLPVVICLSPASTFLHQDQSGTAGHGLVRYYQAMHACLNYI